MPPFELPVPDSPEWDLLARYVAGRCDPDDVRRAEALLRDGGAPVAAMHAAAHAVVARLNALTPMPTAAERVALQQRLHHEFESPTRINAPLARVPRRPVSSWRPVGMRPIAAAVAAACVAVAGTGYLMTHRSTLAESPNRVYQTHRGERALIRLADGSSVVLGAQSSLRYTTPFGQHDRNLYLDGEAYFTVSHAAAHPFVVLTRSSATQVLGTRFVVTAFSDDRGARVAVLDGKVAVRPRTARPGSGVTLTRGDVAHMDAAELMTVTRDADVGQYASWAQGRLVFTHARLSDVIPELERWYNVQIVLADSALASSWITLAIDAPSLDGALAMLADVSNLRWTRRGQLVTVTAHPALTHPNDR